jgi:hypothetical protein
LFWQLNEIINVSKSIATTVIITTAISVTVIFIISWYKVAASSSDKGLGFDPQHCKKKKKKTQ